MAWSDAKNLESEVRRIAAALWGGMPGSAQAQTVAGRERDCIFYGEDITHYIECTISRQPSKIEEDGKKMVQFRLTEAKHGNVVKLWIVTGDTPGADQVSVAKRLQIAILSVHDLRLRLFNGDEYLRCRANYRWGSATNPIDDSSDVSKVAYQYTSLNERATSIPAEPKDVVRRLSGGTAATLLGDFGMGKSMLIRELFTLFAKTYQKESREAKVPIAINLRDHWGQSDPHEVLTRHAKKIGFDKPTQLVKAYNAGEIVLLVDGFDEIVGTPVASRRELKRLRFEALAVVRQFVTDLRGKSGLIVAGRQNFFDTDGERADSLGMRSSDPVFELNEFSPEEAARLLSSFQVKGQIPAWLPKRPLFLAYLASHGLLSEIGFANDLAAADAWERLIAAICTRERRINEYLDASAIKGILERLADTARQTPTGRGPIKPSDIVQAYARSTGYDEPDEHIKPLLMRLPGLSSRSSEDGSREFLDESMLNALRASGLVAFIADPFGFDPQARSWCHGISDLGLDIAFNRLNDAVGSAQRCVVAARQAVERWESPTLAADLVRLGQRLAGDDLALSGCGLRISCGVFEELDLSNCCLHDIVLDNCEIKVLIPPPQLPDGFVIRDSIIWKVQGISNPGILPEWVVGCEIEEYDQTPTNASILLDSDLRMGHRVLLTILRKLYLQRGAGRRENSLSRGLPSGSRELASGILESMKSMGFADPVTLRGYRIWYPDRSRSGEVLAILNDYARSRHPLVEKAREMSEH